MTADMAADASLEHSERNRGLEESAMAKDHGVSVLHEAPRPQRFAESELCVEIERNLREVQTRIDRLANRPASTMTDAEVFVFEEIDRLLYDVVLDMARLEARKVNFVRLPS